jgi:hypothetical protein
MSPWNLFSKGGQKVGEADGGPTKEDIERVAREELGLDVTVDYQRPVKKLPFSWGRCGKSSEEDEGG